MSLFNFFAKKSPSEAPEKKNEPVNEAKPSPVKDEPEVPMSEPAPEAPVPKAESEREKKPAAGQNKPSLWPTPGHDVKSLVFAWKLKIFVDSSFVKSANFAKFLEIWKANAKNEKGFRYFFIASFEKKKLDESERALLDREICREFVCKDYTDCFNQMVEKGLKWNVVLLTDSLEAGEEAFAAASGLSDIGFRWYGLDEACKIKSSTRFAKPREKASERREPKPAPAREPKPEAPFKPAESIAPIARATLMPSRVAAEGDTVTAGGKTYRLCAPVMTDHVSVTYSTDSPDHFAKIYSASALALDVFEKKAARMIEEKIEIRGVCWPQEVIRDASGAFMGIIVPSSRGIQLTKSVFGGATALQQNFPTWDKRDLCALSLTLLNAISSLNSKGIYFGCFNPASVYIVSPTEVYFVDTDSLQIEGYPVISRNITFTPPELISEEKKLRLYNRDEENYQIALIIFMIMMPGKYPYAKKKKREESDSIRSRSFPFSVAGDMKRSQDSERPSGVWQIAWDHLSYRMCSAFYNTFHPNGTASMPGARLGDSDWKALLSDYQKHLNSNEGLESRALFPKTFRHDGKRTFARCSICGQEHPEFYFLRKVRVQGEIINIWDKGYRVCLPCAVDKSNDPNAYFVCQSCKRPFYYTNKTKIIHDIGKLDFDWSNQKWCKDCKKHTVKCSKCGKDVPVYQIRDFRDRLRNQSVSVCSACFGDLVNEEKRRKNAVYERRICRNCGRVFDITVGEADSLRQKGFNLPTKCQNCRGR